MEIAMWLCELGMQQYEQAFHDNGIDATVLPDLTAEDLKELCLTLPPTLLATADEVIE